MAFVHDIHSPTDRPVGESLTELVTAVYRAMPMAMVAVIVIASVIAISMVDRVDNGRLLAWWLLSTTVAVARWGGVLVFRRVSLEQFGLRYWYWIAVVGSLLSGALWGGMSWWVWPESSMYQALLVMMAGGIVAGAVTTLSPLLWAAIPFIVLATVPLALRFFISVETEVANPIGLIILMFTLLTSVSAWRVNGLIRANLEANLGRRQAERELQREAFFDPLTNLPNRRYFLDRLQQEFSRARRHGRTGALLFLDLDNFKTINDSLGHHIGDLLLREVAERLRARFRDEDVAGRLGGDEFVVLLPDVGADPVVSVYEVEKVASQVRELLSEPYRVDEHDLFVSASIGVALFPQEDDSYQDVLKHADTAMYRAKAQGRNNYQFFLPAMQEEASRRLLVEKDLRIALQVEQLELHYQPQVDVEGRITGLEALARWPHPQRGMIPPSEFIPVADDTMLVHDLHEWVARRVCRDIRRMLETCGLEGTPTVSINVSARAFHHASFESQLLEYIARSGIPGDRLCLEITETSVMERVEMVIDKMNALRGSGVVFSVDDFGTGYSSLAYLKRLPVDSLKIDQAFVRDVCSDPNDAAIVEAILAMAQHLGLKVVAEGVEDETTAHFLRERGCNLFQGWLYGRPRPLDEVLASCGPRQETPDKGA